MTAKQFCTSHNVDENDLHGESEKVMAVRAFAARSMPKSSLSVQSWKLKLPKWSHRIAKKCSRGSGWPNRLPNGSRQAYRTLGLHSYFTAGEKEVRAWTSPSGQHPQAAGVIHSDFEKGFIRAEVYSLSDLEQFKTEKEIRAAGKLRVEGKAYIMQDGDICHFLFN